MVICLSDGAYNHLTYFEEKSKYEERTEDMVFEFDAIIIPNLPSPSVHIMKEIFLNKLTLAKLTSW